MGKLELEALRKRARAIGMDPGSIVRAERAKRASYGIGSRQTGLRVNTSERLRPSLQVDVSLPQKWVVAVCAPQRAFGVADDLNDLGFLAYCPIEQKVHLRSRVNGTNARRRIIRQYPKFGAYLFVGEIDGPLQASVNSSIINVLGDYQGSYSINPKLIEAINQAELSGQWDEARVPDWQKHKFKAGERIIVRRGPFADLQGLILECSKAGIKVEFDLFGRKTSTTLQPKALEVA